MNAISNALADLGRGLQLHRVWIALAYEEVGNQHRRTTLGPIWLLINYLAFCGTFIFVFARGDTSVTNYSTYVATGLLVWFLIMETISQSVTVFVRDESFIKGTTLPLSVYVLRQSMQLLIRAGYATVGCVAIILFSGAPDAAQWLSALAGVLVIVAQIPAVVILMGFLGAYFPDGQHIVGNIMRIGMFLTPVFWFSADTGIRKMLYYFNPFTYYIEIVRHPLVFDTVSWAAVLFCTLSGCILWTLALIVLGTYRKKLVFIL